VTHHAAPEALERIIQRELRHHPEECSEETVRALVATVVRWAARAVEREKVPDLTMMNNRQAYELAVRSAADRLRAAVRRRKGQ